MILKALLTVSKEYRQVEEQVQPGMTRTMRKGGSGDHGEGRGNWPVQKVTSRFSKEETLELEELP